MLKCAAFTALISAFLDKEVPAGLLLHGSFVGYIEHNLAIVPGSLCVYANKLAACLWGESFHHLPRSWYPWKAMSVLTLLRVINVYVWVLKRPACITKKEKKKKLYNYLSKQALFSALALLAVVASPRSWLSLSCCIRVRGADVSWQLRSGGRKFRFVRGEVNVKFVFIGYKQHNTVHYVFRLCLLSWSISQWWTWPVTAWVTSCILTSVCRDL